ncbi:NAD-dependent succinate-semialdehyde dehydrogenase [Acinetobacter larvae]|uniref:Succinate-semialdehyde dehydrogenase (NADP(+)) n=1 Tax=Acinetobacter larvae TaxID=1789224 RepID=A0A1B2LXV3_9GAMM|nr:NAD-dependent succinate-semialdehyde dehydrogenase [Acinetobacter larvae]AOA57766.1 succinate-semialdehyde dehydrogenase (NADP(+)) [Acinetobacter larvae]
MDITQFKIFKNLSLIDGAWVGSDQSNTIDVFNPADQSFIATIPALSAAQISAAIASSEQALSGWQARSMKQRADILKKWYALIMQHQDELATIMTVEQGKPLHEAKGEVGYAASFIEWFAEEGRRMNGDTIPAATTDKRIMTRREAVGVCVAITPWNFPAAMITRKAAPALVAGCSMIVKPAQETPFTALALVHLAELAGVPKGVLNIVTGKSAEIVPIMTASPVVKKLSFTGSTPVGAQLMQQSAPTLKKLSLELGGNAPLIVFDDADIDVAVQGVMDSKFRNAGQTCVCSNRIFVQAQIYEQFVEKLASKVAALNVGNGLVAGTEIGPLINAKAIAKIEAHIADAVAKGAEVVVGGQVSALGGHYFQPTVIQHAQDDMLCFSDETFAPLAPIFKFEQEDEVIQRANNTEYGLASYIFTENLNRSIRVSEALQYGMVGINTGLISTAEAPFGGVKASGLGREGSRHGLDEYTEIKYICIGHV